jgi:hypothetical protein
MRCSTRRLPASSRPDGCGDDHYRFPIFFPFAVTACSIGWRLSELLQTARPAADHQVQVGAASRRRAGPAGGVEGEPVAAIPDAGGARCAPHGVTTHSVTTHSVTPREVMTRALLRVVVLVGVVVAGWLLGSGTGLANENSGHVDLAHSTGLAGLVKASPPDRELEGRFGAPPTAKSTVQSVMRFAPVPRLAVQVPALVPVLTPVLAHVSEHVSAPVLKPVLKPASHATPARSRAIVDKPAAVPLAGPVVQAEPTPAPAAAALQSEALQSKAEHPTVRDGALPTPVSAATHAVADHLAEPLALGGKPATPVPASPPVPTTAACPAGSSGGGATTKSACFATLSGGQAMADLVPGHRLHTSSGSLPGAAVEQPSSSPD